MNKYILSFTAAIISLTLIHDDIVSRSYAAKRLVLIIVCLKEDIVLLISCSCISARPERIRSARSRKDCITGSAAVCFQTEGCPTSAEAAEMFSLIFVKFNRNREEYLVSTRTIFWKSSFFFAQTSYCHFRRAQAARNLLADHIRYQVSG